MANTRVEQSGPAFLTVVIAQATKVEQSGPAFLTLKIAQGTRAEQSGPAFLTRVIKIISYLEITPPFSVPSPRMQVPPVLD